MPGRQLGYSKRSEAAIEVTDKSARRKCLLVTAGPTRERIDPVRFISNYSTGTFGYEIAKAAKRRGYSVILVSGPTALKQPRGVKLIRVESARDMKRAVMSQLPKAEAVVMAAAVSDWRPRTEAKRKIKKGAGRRVLELVENDDILSEVGARKRGKVVAGFALETENLERNALKKLLRKNADLIIANKLGASSIFGDGRTSVVMIDKWGNRVGLRNRTKRELAASVLDRLEAFTARPARMRRGVTLVELVFVVAVFLALSAILTPVVKFTNDRFRAIRCADNVRQISLALHSYAADHNDVFPQGLGQLYPDYIREQKAFDCPASASPGTQDKPDYEYVAGLTELSPQTEVIVYDREAHHRGGRKHLLRIDGSVELVKSDGKPR